MAMTPIQVLGKCRWKRLMVNSDDGKSIPAIKCEGLVPQQVEWVGNACKLLEISMVDREGAMAFLP